MGFTPARGRCSSYTLKNGNIRPTPKAKLECFDPWQVKLAVLPHPTSRSIRASFFWEGHCASRFRMNSMPRALTGFFPGAANADCWESSSLYDPCLAGTSLAASRGCADAGEDGVLPARRFQQLSRSEWPIGPTVHGIGRPLGTRPQRGRRLEAKAMMWDSTSDVQGLIVEPLDHAWGDFFPDVPAKAKGTFSYPMPTGQEFWHMYSANGSFPRRNHDAIGRLGSSQVDGKSRADSLRDFSQPPPKRNRFGC